MIAPLSQTRLPRRGAGKAESQLSTRKAFSDDWPTLLQGSEAAMAHHQDVREWEDAEDIPSARFARMVCRRLSLASIIAGVASWTVVMAPAVRSVLFANGAALSVTGIAATLSPIAVWLAARSVMDKPQKRLGVLWLWLISMATGFSAGALFNLATGESITSVFAVSALGFGFLTLLIGNRSPSMSWTLATFGLAAIVVTIVFDVLMTQTALYLAVDGLGALAIGILTALAAPGWRSIHKDFEFSHGAGAMADFGALNVLLATRWTPANTFERWV